MFSRHNKPEMGEMRVAVRHGIDSHGGGRLRDALSQS